MKFPILSETRMVQDHIFDIQKNIIQDIADREDCIIVGRCADAVLKEHKNCIRIYIYASEEQRLKNCVDVLRMDPREARKMIKEVDQARESYHSRYAGYLPNDENHQDKQKWHKVFSNFFNTFFNTQNYYKCCES